MSHTLSLLEAAPYPSRGFCCNLCRTEGCGPVYHCLSCDFDIHIFCAAVASPQTHFSHPQHPLHLSPCLDSCPRTCNSCGSSIRTWSFRCDDCDFDIHSMCARAPQSILHPHHPDPLVLSDASLIPGKQVCDGCMMPVTNLFYQCRTCQYNLHQVCATLPTEIKHVKHRDHMLIFKDQPSLEVPFPICKECRNPVQGWHFHCCCNCDFNLHPRCAQLVHELPHVDFEAAYARTRSNGMMSANTTVMCNPSHAPASSVLHMPSQNDWEAVERVLRFSKEVSKLAHGMTQETASTQSNEEQEDCPTCLEGFDMTNPKKSTSCGHQFHLACILAWKEHSTSCPICRKTFDLVP